MGPGACLNLRDRRERLLNLRTFQDQGFQGRCDGGRELYNTGMDERNGGEFQLPLDDRDVLEITDVIRQSIVVLSPDGATLYANRAALETTGVTAGEVIEKGFFMRAFHPDDVERIREEREVSLLEGLPFELEMRCLVKSGYQSGQYRWQLFQYDALKDESGRILRWYVTATDIDDRKRNEERLRNENFVLRKDIDRSAMFE